MTPFLLTLCKHSLLAAAVLALAAITKPLWRERYGARSRCALWLALAVLLLLPVDWSAPNAPVRVEPPAERTLLLSAQRGPSVVRTDELPRRQKTVLSGENDTILLPADPPVTLWAVLKSVAYAWQQQSLTDDAKQLFDLSRELYERFSTLGDYAIKLGTQITKTVSAYNKFASSLERRVLPTARKLQKIEPTKIIEEVPIIESDKGNVSELSAPEVVPADEGDTHLTASGDSLES